MVQDIACLLYFWHYKGIKKDINKKDINKKRHKYKKIKYNNLAISIIGVIN